MFVQVLVELKAKNLSKTFTYEVPKSLIPEIEIGKRVLVPFGKQELEGFILKIEKEQTYDYEIKKIVKVIDENPVLNEELLELGPYLSKKTFCNLIHAYQTMLPKALKAKTGVTVSKKYITYLYCNQNNLKKYPLTKKQQEIIELFGGDNKVEKKEAISISPSAVKTLIKKGVLYETLEEAYRIKEKVQEIIEKPTLTEEQNKVVEEIKLHEFMPYLLHGVTGSGKTEVYMSLIEEVLNNKKEALVLVPEISLTPQLVSKFRSRFGSRIAILHSRLSDGERFDEWRKIERKEVDIVIGARSAVFAPLANLGIIIVDEEHSLTYKQEVTPKYHAIDIALWRGKRHKCPIVLGSATPSIESYTRAQAGIYKLCTLKNRISQNMPEVICIDMKDEIRKGNSILSECLSEKIKEKLDKKEQVILLLNRRGYTTVTTCKSCGYTYKCPNCDIPLTYHKASFKMRCHYCGYTNNILRKCPSCNSESLNQYGMGTEKLEQYINEQFKDVSILRMDVDTTSKKGSYEKMISDFEQEKYQILIGTQMIAKGLDFPNVTLVGVINSDATLQIPDFRSAERTFQLLSQVAGRAGRSTKKGEVILQGFHMDHYSIVSAKKHDYLKFYNEEMNIRKMLKYSPYYNLCLCSIKSRDENVAYQEGQKIVNYLNKEKKEDIFILGPSFAAMPKVNNIYQVQVIIKYKKKESIYPMLTFLHETYRNQKKVEFSIDIDPIKL